MAAVEAGRALDATVEPASPRPPAVRRAPIALVVVTVAVAAATLVPLAYLIMRAADAGASGALEVLRDPRTAGLLIRTTALAIAVTASAVAIGVPLAWLTTRTDLPGRRAWAVIAAMPLVIPTYVGGYAFAAALGPTGIVQEWLEPFGVRRLPEIYGFPGAWLVLTLFTYPYVLLTVRAAIRRLDPSLEEVAASLGHGSRATFRRVVAPQLRPSIAAGGLLVALYTVHDFGAVSLMRFDTFTRAIYVSYQGSFDRSRAALLSLVLVALTLVVLAAEARTRRRASYHRLHGSAQRVARSRPLGAWRWPAAAACATLAAVALGIPIGVIVHWMVRSVREAEPLGRTMIAAAHSLQASGLAAAVALLAAWPIAVLGARHPGRLARATERASFVGYALPGVVVALALVFLGIRALPSLYQTLPMLVFAYVVLFLPQAAGSLRTSLLQVGPQLEEAARALGAGRARVLARIVLPLVRPGIVAGAALVFLTAMKELPATLLLAPTGYRTLATEVWSATNAAFFDRAAPPALALLVVASIPLGVLLGRER